MANIYNETILLKTCECDMGQTWKPGAILEAMQETAGWHACSFGLDHPAMMEMGVAWVLSRLKVEFIRMPAAGEKITIETYPTPNRHLFFPRSHVFRDEKGEEIGRANSLWVTMDIHDRKIVKRDGVLAKMPDNAELKMAAGMPATVRPLDGEVKPGVVIPQYTDLDVNEHVNNAKYLDWCCNALGIEVLREKCIMSFDVNYDMEIRPGCEVRTELTMKDDEFAFCGFVEDKKSFSVGGKLVSRK